MSFCNERTVKASKKRKCCALCFEDIEIGQPKVIRKGTNMGDFYTMHMHPECHAYEGVCQIDEGWYDYITEPAFTRAEALAYFSLSRTETRQSLRDRIAAHLRDLETPLDTSRL